MEIVLNAENLTREDIEEFIREYTDAEFTITLIESTEDEEVRVIVKFSDVENAKSFVDTVKASNDGKTTIKKVGFIREGPGSFSAMFHPMKLFLI